VANPWPPDVARPRATTDIDDNVYIYEAKLVAKGYRQRQGVEFDETISLVAMLKKK